MSHRTLVLVASSLSLALSAAAHADPQRFELAYRHPRVVGESDFTDEVINATARSASSIRFGRHEFVQMEGKQVYRCTHQPDPINWHYLYWLDDGSFIHKEGAGPGYTLYMNELPSGGERAALVNRMVEANKQALAEIEGEHEDRVRDATQGFLLGLRSKQSNPSLEKGIRHWWGETNEGKLVRVAFLEPGWETIRNWRGEVLARNTAALLLVRRKDGCAIQWRRFGYESVGGGKFASDVKWWTVANSTPLRYAIGGTKGGVTLTAGIDQAVDCAALK